MIYNYENLPADDNLNRFSYCIEVSKQMFIQKGKMIAYYGSLRFELLGSSLLDILVQNAFNAPLYINNFVVVTGTGKLILGDNSKDIASYDLEKAHLTVKSSHVLAFESTLTCQESTLNGYLTFLGTGKFIASSNGPAYFMEPEGEPGQIGRAVFSNPSGCQQVTSIDGSSNLSRFFVTHQFVSMNRHSLAGQMHPRHLITTTISTLEGCLQQSEP